MRRSSLPGFFGVRIYDVLTFIRGEIKEDSIITRANSMAYSFLLSLFPFALVLITLIPYMPIDNYVDLLEKSIQEINGEVKLIPFDTERQIIDTIREFISRPRSGLLSFGFVLAIFYASNGVMALMRGFDKNHEISFISRNALQKRLIALKLTSYLGTLFFLSIFLIIAGDYIINWLVQYIDADAITSISFRLVRWLVVLLMFYTGITLIYREGSALKRKVPFFSPGATLATTLTILSSVIFSVVVNQYEMYSNVYGSIGTLIGFMLWLQINAFILIIGFELNTSIAVNRDLRRANKKKITAN